ncbi:MAG TPA: c-type cytochrome [Gemmatimonadaceae bacterium]|nr:c-type cytochrome [Gemmatimonadaceae bacterium]
MRSGSIIMGIAAVAIGAITLHQRVAHAKQLPPIPDGVQAVDGKAIYLKSCKECHGVLGAPTKASLRKYDKIANFTDSKFFTTRKDADMLKAIEKGKGRDMKGFADKLSAEEMKAVLVYIHTLHHKE